MSNLKARIKAAIFLLFNSKESGWYMITTSFNEMNKIVDGKDYDVSIYYGNMPEFIFFKSIKSLAAIKDDVDMVLCKAKFEAEREVHNQTIPVDNIKRDFPVLFWYMQSIEKRSGPMTWLRIRKELRSNIIYKN